MAQKRRFTVISELLALECSKNHFAVQTPHGNTELRVLVNGLFSAKSSCNAAFL